MEKKYARYGLWGALALWFLMVTSCASIYEVQVLYKLPAPGQTLQGKSIQFKLVDQRQTKEFLRPGAKRELKHFSNNISLAVARYNEAGFKIGPLAPLSAIEKAFKSRIENEGIKVVKKSGPSVPELEIALKDFSLDFVDRKWVASMSYDARVKVEGRVRATQGISASAERYKLVRNQGADLAVGDIFTDALNQLDLVRLFSDAHLL